MNRDSPSTWSLGPDCNLNVILDWSNGIFTPEDIRYPLEAMPPKIWQRMIAKASLPCAGHAHDPCHHVRLVMSWLERNKCKDRAMLFLCVIHNSWNMMQLSFCCILFTQQCTPLACITCTPTQHYHWLLKQRAVDYWLGINCHTCQQDLCISNDCHASCSPTTNSSPCRYPRELQS